MTGRFCHFGNVHVTPTPAPITQRTRPSRGVLSVSEIHLRNGIDAFEPSGILSDIPGDARNKIARVS
jgi:hypothetical protein